MLRYRKAKGYTLLEIVVVAVITSVMFLLGARWLIALTTAANSPLMNRESTQITYALDKLENDLRLSVGCDPYSKGGSLQGLTESTLTFTSDEGSDGNIEKIYWRLHESKLQRAMLPGSNCSYPEPQDTDWSTVASNIEGAPYLFNPVKDAQTLTPASEEGCTSENCGAQVLRVSIKSSVSNASTVRSITLP